MRGSHYTDEQNQFIRDHAELLLRDLAAAYNQRFGASMKPEALGKKRKSLGLPPAVCARNSMFSPEEDQYLRENYEKFTSKELAGKLHERFGINPSTQTVTDRLLKLGIRRGNCYTPKGYLPRACKPIGYERIDKNRTVMVKVAHPDVWKPKAQIIMGYDPKKEQVIFLDGNSLNVVPENMVVVSRRIHARLAKNGWLNSSNEVLFAGIKWAELLYAIKELVRNNG